MRMDEDLRLDGNAAGGVLGEIFALEMTAARGTCAYCGAKAELGAVVVYVHAPGTVLRCPQCAAVLLRVVRAPDRLWLDARGVSCLELGADT
jgi:ribosomal protein L24E